MSAFTVPANDSEMIEVEGVRQPGDDREHCDYQCHLAYGEEHILMRRLSVWAGGWTLEGAEAVSAHGEALVHHEVLEQLTGLVDKSLVETDERDGQIRFRMLETLRHYGAARLAEAGEAEAIHARHLAWCVEMAERAEPEVTGNQAATWLGRLDLEIPNLRAALDCAAANEADAALRLVSALTFFWLARGCLVEGTGRSAVGGKSIRAVGVAREGPLGPRLPQPLPARFDAARSTRSGRWPTVKRSATWS